MDARNLFGIEEASVNWLDIVLIGILAFGALRGLRIGLLGAIVNVAALLVGWLLAAQIANAVAGLLGNLGIVSGFVVSALYYALIILAVVGAMLAWRALRGPLGIATLGLSSTVDRIGGLALGLLIGLVLSAGLLLALARLTYSLPSDDAFQMLERVDVNVGMETALVESVGARIFVGAVSELPASALGFVPSAFADSLDMLERRL